MSEFCALVKDEDLEIIFSDDLEQLIEDTNVFEDDNVRIFSIYGSCIKRSKIFVSKKNMEYNKRKDFASYDKIIIFIDNNKNIIDFCYLFHYNNRIQELKYSISKNITFEKIECMIIIDFEEEIINEFQCEFSSDIEMNIETIKYIFDELNIYYI